MRRFIISRHSPGRAELRDQRMGEETSQVLIAHKPLPSTMLATFSSEAEALRYDRFQSQVQSQLWPERRALRVPLMASGPMRDFQMASKAWP
jgi:hypothetical protein